MRFEQNDRVLHRRKWYAVVLDDTGGPFVTVRFDDGTPPTQVLRDQLRLVQDVDAEVHELITSLTALRDEARLSAQERETISRTMDALTLALTEHGLRVRVAAEIESLIRVVENEPYDPEVAGKARVRQWFTDGAVWSLGKLRHHAARRKEEPRSTHLAF